MAKLYNPDEVTLTVAGAQMAGYADGSFVTVKPAAARIVKVVGTDGHYSISRHADRGATLEITLMQTSDSNDILDALVDMPGFGVYLRDRNGRTIREAPAAWIEEVPEEDFDRSAKERKWVIGVERLSGVIGGSTGTAG
jgi:hypothetical protein